MSAAKRRPRRALFSVSGRSGFVLQALEQRRMLSAGPSTGAATAAGAGVARVKDLFIVAHHDDDLLFMNPDIRSDIVAGNDIEIIYVTAGSNNSIGGMNYATAREAGVMAAYARMAQAPNQWRLSMLSAGGASVRDESLGGGSANVDLIFMRLPAGNIDGTVPVWDTDDLRTLWLGISSTITALDGSATYTKPGLIAALGDLMQQFHPDHISTLDHSGLWGTGADPSGVKIPFAPRGGSDYWYDHSDHYYSAVFAAAAEAQYHAPHTTSSYRGYNNANDPANVAGLDLVNKTAAFASYAGYDENIVDQPPFGFLWDTWLARQYQVAAPLRIPFDYVDYGVLKINFGDWHDPITLDVSGSRICVTQLATTSFFDMAGVNAINVNATAAGGNLIINAQIAQPLNFIGAAGSGGDVVNISAGASVTFNATQQLGALNDMGRVILKADGNRTLYVDSLTIAPSAALDLNDNDLVVGYGSNPSPFSAIRDYVFSGYSATSDASKAGIVSSTGQSAGNTILAFLDNALIGASDWPPGSGHTIDANSVVCKYTCFGDANLDGQVTADDYGILDANFNTTPPLGIAWLAGDANLDGRVTPDDYGILDANFGRGAGSALAPPRPDRESPIMRDRSWLSWLGAGEIDDPLAG